MKVRRNFEISITRDPREIFVTALMDCFQTFVRRGVRVCRILREIDHLGTLRILSKRLRDLEMREKIVGTLIKAIYDLSVGIFALDGEK